MPTPRVTARMEYPERIGLPIRVHNRFMRASLRETAVHHHREHIPKHTKPGADVRYGYKKRDPKYQRLKDQLGLPPLVSPNPDTSGSLQTMVNTQRRVTATRKKSTLFLDLPFFKSGSSFKTKTGQTSLSVAQREVVHRKAEMEAITRDEVEDNTRFLGERYQRRWEAYQVVKRITV